MARLKVLDPSYELKTERRQLRLSPDLIKSIQAHADMEGWAFSETVDYLLRYAIKDHVQYFANGVPNLLADTLATIAKIKTEC